jgi:hypothetical protein
MKELILLLAREDHAPVCSCCFYMRVDVVVGGQHELSYSIFKKGIWIHSYSSARRGQL